MRVIKSYPRVNRILRASPPMDKRKRSAFEMYQVYQQQQEENAEDSGELSEDCGIVVSRRVQSSVVLV